MQCQIVDLAGVSREAVSHVLNGTTGKAYNAETRVRIRKIAREQGCHAHRGGHLLNDRRIPLQNFGGKRWDCLLPAARAS